MNHPDAMDLHEPVVFSERKQTIRARADQQAPEREKWIARNAYSYEEHHRYLRFLIPKGTKVLELGCGIGHTLAALEPSRGVGVDFSEGMIQVARERHPHLDFLLGDVEDVDVLRALDHPFDVILLSDTIGELEDVEATLRAISGFCARDTRVVIGYYSTLWEPILKLGEAFGLAMPHGLQNWLSTSDIVAILQLSDFDVVKREWRQLLPKRLLGIGPVVNRFIGTLPIVRTMCLRNYIVARAVKPPEESLSATVVIPCKNERGNVEPAVKRLPKFCDDLEIMFVEGGSQDGTREEIERVIAHYSDHDVKLLVQDGKGKGDAVRKGFRNARGDVLMILDADLTVPPEWLPRFYEAVRDGRGEFINGTRLVYPMEDQAMRILNHIANQVFAVLFSWLLNQRVTDTLCGTKVLRRTHYRAIEANREYFGEFDPFGDFDLLFGASKLNLRIVDVPVRYASRVYGETQISRFRHGWLLLRMVGVAFRKLKAF